MKTYLEIISRGGFLTEAEAIQAMELVCNELTCPIQAATFLSIVHTRGESKIELLGFLRYLKTQLIPIDTGSMTVLDTCGTGGDHANTFNISTASALLLASAGIKVAKHGGRAVSSQCGSADVLEELGVFTQSSPKSARLALEQTGFAFILAPQFNRAYSVIRSLRSKIGIRTSFNLLGPLLNPAQVKHQVIGVSTKAFLRPLAEILQHLGAQEIMLVHSQDGLDECSISAPTNITHLSNGSITDFVIHPNELGITQAPLSSLQGGNAAQNARIIQRIFTGEIGAPRESVILNAAAGFVVAGMAQNFKEGISLARETIDTKRATNFLNQFSEGNNHGQ